MHYFFNMTTQIRFISLIIIPRTFIGVSVPLQKLIPQNSCTVLLGMIIYIFPDVVGLSQIYMWIDMNRLKLKNWKIAAAGMLIIAWVYLFLVISQG